MVIVVAVMLLVVAGGLFSELDMKNKSNNSSAIEAAVKIFDMENEIAHAHTNTHTAYTLDEGARGRLCYTTIPFIPERYCEI